MITRIEIDGFKTFQQFALQLAPFQVVVGVNGTGKSNLFDALRLLARLADTDLRTAFLDLRGEAGELFTVLPDGQSVNQMKLAVELFIDRHIKDSWGAEATLKYTRLRYDLHIERRADEHGLERLYVTYESLKPLPRQDDLWIKHALGKKAGVWLPKLTGGRSSPFISTVQEDGGSEVTTILLHQDGRSGLQKSVAEQAEKTIISGVYNTGFPHAFAVREEMRSWKFLQLNPEILRQPVSMLAPTTLAPDGRYLPNTLARMESEDPYVLADVSRDLANLVPGILSVEIERDQSRDRYLIRARMQDGQSFSSRVLSDGTLRLLALVTLKNDPQHRGVLCFEEPENGVHPFRLEQMAGILCNLTTDLSDPQQQELPLRQLLVNTHSPVFASQPDVRHNLLFAQMVPRVRPDGPGKKGTTLRTTRIVPVIPPGVQLKLRETISTREQAYTLEQAIHYLQSAQVHEAVSELQGNGSVC